MVDWSHFPTKTAGVEPWATPANAIGLRNLLYIVAALVFAMVLVGGATRLTESGLSITQWKPIEGVIPPLSEQDWNAEFEQYKQIPQFQQLFPTMDLDRFKVIFAWEWAHRLLGRLVGLVFVAGLAWHWVRGRIPQGYKPKLLGILALGALQGAVGWWMVASGLVSRVEVAQERLAIHLLLAAFIMSACIWVGSSLGPQSPTSILHGARGRLRFESLLLLALVFMQIGLGALVAGLRAGLVDNTWPLMEGGLVPPPDSLWPLSPWWDNIFENPVTAQFFHRMTAYVVLALALAHMFDAALNATGRAARGGFIVFGHVLMQVALGIATLLFVADWWSGAPHILLALAHQAVGVAVLAVATLQARRLIAA
ncbi:MAG TPA: COX15/CtaA family protein [Methylocystis sp.]|nr:COX15/CtaA family protein [Methylocystis sp.]